MACQTTTATPAKGPQRSRVALAIAREAAGTTSSPTHATLSSTAKDTVWRSFQKRSCATGSTMVGWLSSQPQARDTDLSAADPSWAHCRVSQKPISRGQSIVDVRVEDLFNEPEKSQYARYPNQKSSIAAVELPSRVYWGRMLLGMYPALYIASPESSLNSSQNGSPISLTNVSPSGVWSPSM